MPIPTGAGFPPARLKVEGPGAASALRQAAERMLFSVRPGTRGGHRARSRSTISRARALADQRAARGVALRHASPRFDDRDDLPAGVLLRDYPFEMVRLACTRCGRRGQYRKSTLLARFGPNCRLVSMRLDLAEGCPRSGRRHRRALRHVLMRSGGAMKAGGSPAQNTIGAGSDQPLRQNLRNL